MPMTWILMTMVMMMVIMPLLMLMLVMMIMILMMGGDDEMLDPKWDIDIVPSKADGDNLN